MADFFRVTVTKAHFTERARDLQKRLETRRREDEEKLRALDLYASDLGCRSVFIRRYFGEEDPPVCGECDRCRPSTAAEAGAGAEAEEKEPPGRARRRGRRRRSRRGGAQAG